MKRKLLSALLIATSASVGTVHAANTDVRITEWMYSGAVGEFVEFTNTGASAVSFAGWSFDDDSRLPGVLDLSAFGFLAAGESAIITETDAASFRSEWNLGAGVKIIGNYTNNLGRNDEINLFDGANVLIDRLTYGDQNFPGTIRTQDRSGHPDSVAALGANNVALWSLSSVGDVEGSFLSVSGDIGSPGQSSFISAVPEPSTYLMMLSGLALLAFGWRRKQRAAEWA